MFSRGLFVLIATVGVTLAAQAVPPPGSSRPLSERLRERFEPSGIAARVRRFRDDSAANGASVDPATAFVIDGRRNPELFLPYELLNGLLRGVQAPSEVRAQVRDSYRDFIVSAQWDVDEFWRNLENAAAPHMAAIRELHARRSSATASTDVERRVCSTRRGALERMRAIYGHPQFDDFLYRSVAPSLLVVSRVVPGTVESLQAIEEGCR